MSEPCLVTGFVKNAVIKYSLTVAKTAFTYLKNTEDAEDITQDVFVTLMLKNPVFENDDHCKAWLIRVTINKCKDYRKSSWFRNRIHSIPDELSYLQPEEEEVLSAVSSLEVKYRMPIHLYYYEGYSIKEIAEILDEKPATIGTRMARGRNILKKKIGGFEDE